MHTDQMDSEARWIELAQSGDADAMKDLLVRHFPLITALAARMRADYIDKEVFVQAGSIGLMLAVRHYQSGRDVKLTTYAVPWILGEMKRALRKEATCCVSLEGEAHTPEGSLLEKLRGSDDIDMTGIDLRIALEKLSDELHLVICLRYFRDKTQKETALLLKKSQAQISRMERAALDALLVHLA